MVAFSFSFFFLQQADKYAESFQQKTFIRADLHRKLNFRSMLYNLQSASQKNLFKANNLFRSGHMNQSRQNNGIMQSADQKWRQGTPVSSSCGTWSRFQMDDSLCAWCLQLCGVHVYTYVWYHNAITYLHYTHTHVFSSVSLSLSVWPSLCITIDLYHSKWLIPFK